MSTLRLFLPSGLSLLAVTVCAVILLIRYSRERRLPFLLLAAALLSRAGHHLFAVWVRYMVSARMDEVAKWSGFRLSGSPHPQGMAFHVWDNMTTIDNLFYLLSYIFLIILIALELRTRRDDKMRSDLKRELDHSI